MARVVVLFTTNRHGGIVQFTRAFSNACVANGYETHVYYPEGSDELVEGRGLGHRYRSVKLMDAILSGKKLLKNITQEIIGLNPEIVIFCDQGVASMILIEKLQSKTRMLLTVHDPTPHPTNDISFRSCTRRLVSQLVLSEGFDQVDALLLLSKSSLSQFRAIHPEKTLNLLTMPLGAHPTSSHPVRPRELGDLDSYFLFFGRIDKYKGISRLARSYSEAEVDTSLVVAGNGSFTEGESGLLEDSGAVIINRFISDGEMAWLFTHARCVVLPYIEASQSGVLVMSYFYGKPVVVSDLPGLCEFVEQNVTGIVCKTERDFSDAFRLLDDSEVSEEMGKAAKRYEVENLDWNKNVSSLMKELF